MVNHKQLLNLPSSDELPDSDDKPVDREIQILIPNLLMLILNQLWGDRYDWFFGVNMGIFHTTGSSPRVAIVPDALLSLGVPRLKNNKLRSSYVLWEENYVVPIRILEIVSKTYGGEYNEKMIDYARLGVLYYVIYNPDYTKRDKHEQFEVYYLVDGAYQRLKGNPVWMPEIGLGIGTEVGNHYRSEQEWLYWYDSEGNRFMTPEEEALQERQRAERLEQMLRSLGVDPEQL
ncbi:MAG: Uma2 family endonuclease [Okeania sp. SIO2G4]|uniref:Uma2 family endonuclease n=1 Tax=unclassified Okeania TaxID=2634635 RepID=UPI0013B852E3|nr:MULTISPECIES: Uma2 family endonuclease [unclassified Okeania]NEP07120.1 Uma2 family endonuclease [Okeania sp. SIO4D6]NEP38991.1 Uma2 family endonuclease [Okeania sp. SIO2H7]NEP76041.1 Uma2 family endonuclease [Okeania sp. SIO2G5]NEP97287.1 Uma2 family endonuclease [Okeania sp. SIO2F5]NEQ95016.1 Uma2 family endonuclease [Okeania sp. SIO2G4]